MTEKREPVFVQRLTYIVVTFAGLGALLIMVDPVITLVLSSGDSVKLGGEGFSEQLKGAVIQTLLIGGWTTALGFWLRITPTEQRQQETVSRMAEQAAPNLSKAVAAARSDPLPPAVPGVVEPWVTGKDYTTEQVVSPNGSGVAYVCIVPHTSGVFKDDLAASRWALKNP